MMAINRDSELFETLKNINKVGIFVSRMSKNPIVIYSIDKSLWKNSKLYKDGNAYQLETPCGSYYRFVCV